MEIGFDTVVICSPYLSQNCSEAFLCKSVKKVGIDVKNARLMYEFTSSELEGSFDYRIRLNLKTNEEGTYLEVECSLNKFFFGHNIFGGRADLKQFQSLVQACEAYLDVTLPYYEDWTVKGIDIACIFNLGSLENVKRFLDCTKRVCVYPKREIKIYGCTGVYWSGQTTTLKLYAKGVEFRRHDKLRLASFYSDNEMLFLENVADRILRVEVEVHIKKLKALHDGKLPLVKELDIIDLINIYDNEIEKVFKVNSKKIINVDEYENVKEKLSMRIVKESYDVEQRLNDVYGSRLARTLIGTWYIIVNRGMEHAREVLSKPTYYRHVKLLKEANIAFVGSDIGLTEKSNVISIDEFIPTRDSRYIITSDNDIFKSFNNRIKLLS